MNQHASVPRSARVVHISIASLIIFLSDNGGPTRELTSSNAPLRGEKGSMCEGGLRVPFMMQWKGELPAGRVEDRMVVSVDLLPTAAALTGGRIPKDIDGVDLMPYLKGEKADSPHETFFWRQGTRTALRQGDWKLINMTRKRDQPRWELHNIANDLSEQRDLATEQPTRLEQMKKTWEQWNGQMAEPLFR